MDDEFERFSRSVAPSLHRLALAVSGGGSADADDLVQATLEKMLLAWGRRTVRDPHAYARTVLVREHASIRRRVGWKREVLRATAPERPVARDDFDESDQRATLHHALRQLPLRQRQSVVLHYLEDLSVPEVAQILGCSQGTVKRSASRGIHALRALVPTTQGESDHDLSGR